MPNDLERAFGALESDADRAALLPAAEVRRLAGRRSRNATLAGALTVAVLVAGVSVGSRWVLSGDTEPRPLPPLQTTSVAPAPAPSSPVQARPSDPPSALPSSTPVSSAPPASSAPALPSSIPARALLNGKDGNGTGEDLSVVDSRRPPKLCSDTTYPSSSKSAVRKSVMLLYRSPDAPENSVPDDTVYDTVTVYKGTGAEDVLDELRKAVRDCPDAGEQVKYRSLGSFGAGDESLLVERSRPTTDLPGDPVPGADPTLTYIAMARVGDTVAMVECVGYENWGSTKASAVELAKTAAERVADWRG
jgi:hypothetical protein